ncbi:MAG: HAMP domain-containing sensor histidine kinase, partial [Candidatus Sumerlaeota bacterium]|nr:HAMP domain-containing sensor histidine kinase [Candidatus Sumerlaeota bacterium]
MSLLAFLVYGLLLAVALFELDKAYYQEAKREIIRRSQYDIFPALNDYLNGDLASQYLQADSEEARGRARKRLEELFLGIVSRDWSIFRVRLLDRDYDTLLEEPSPADQTRKIRQCNSFRNCLFLLNFEGSIRQFVSHPGDTPREIIPLGWIEVSYTSPQNLREIEILTTRYRIYAVWLAALVTLLFAALYRLTILPLRRVSSAVEHSLRRQPLLLRRPASSLERGYNELARDALLNALEGEIRDWIEESMTAADAAGLYDRLVEGIGRLFGFPIVSIREMRSQDAAAPLTIRVHRHLAPGANALDSDAFSRAEARQFSLAGAEGSWDLPGSPFRFVTRPIHEGASALDRRSPESKEFSALTLGFDPSAWGAHASWPTDTAARLASETAKAVESLRLHQANVFRQRSEASVNLAENLGHDLTNIIATAKVDLATLKQILDHGAAPLAESPRLQEVLSESIEHLLANTRFLQEIVNIYRAFTNLRRPVYEDVDLNDLVAQISRLFLSAISGRVRLEVAAAPGLSRCNAEPRLIKLALFNLLSNASDAIKAAQAAGGGEAAIQVRTQCDGARREALLAVRDNGPGIRDSDGRLATPEEISRILRLGISSKRDSPGSGLGLSWVRSIVEEFHAGRL